MIIKSIFLNASQLGREFFIWSVNPLHSNTAARNIYISKKKLNPSIPFFNTQLPVLPQCYNRYRAL